MKQQFLFSVKRSASESEMDILRFIKNIYLCLLLAIIPAAGHGQTCTILSKANTMSPDRLCSPVTVNWNVSYTGVNNAGTPVSIIFDWDNGNTEILDADETSPGFFQATASNVYTAEGDRCNYHPVAMLVVDGVTCTSSAQEQIVTVWDNDDSNGGEMHISPEVYPVCYGSSASVIFTDLTQFNCVPPQENDNPNVNTRWIQWIYGTDITLSGTPATVGGNPVTVDYYGGVITLTGPVTGSGITSDIIHVGNDNDLWEYFEVTLRNWNYCNPYDDPSIDGPPDDPVNGDHPPVETTARILIVPYPDATITPAGPLCANAPPLILHAHDSGGTWSGDGVSGDRFDPEVAGPGDHIIRYSVTNEYGCTDEDNTIITVLPLPDATITPVGTLCATDEIITLSAKVPGGIWTGPGVSGNTFNPLLTGPGSFQITYSITDANGCSNSDEITITVITPDATIVNLDTLCVTGSPVLLTAHDQGGVWSGPGVIGDRFHPGIAGAGDHIISYNLVNPDCQDSDTALVTVMPYPEVSITGIGTVFLGSPSIVLEATPEGGVFSGPGITGNTFNPFSAGTGNHVISYNTIPDRWGCWGSDTIHIKVIMPPLPQAGFIPDTAGCSPLKVRFSSTSLYAESWLWDYGDRNYSTVENPEHTWYIPGIYTVTLTVNNLSGTSVHQEEVTVYRNPVAIFDAWPTEVINNEQVVVFYNYSQGATASYWDFGDGDTSEEEHPWHKYNEAGNYDVSLVVVSENGCIDSAGLNTPVVVRWEEGSLDFPSVFKWNRTGPTGGTWQEGIYPEMDFVFRPFYDNIIDYKLQIFNRWGVLIFESTDLRKGWDGYHGDGNLALQGVYVWKATGRFADGEYFDMVGDVTFLH